MQDHHYILNWFQMGESHIKLKGLRLASGSGKARMSILVTSCWLQTLWITWTIVWTCETSQMLKANNTWSTELIYSILSMLYSLIQNMLHIDIFSSSYCNMNGHQFYFLFHMIQGLSSASSLNIHFRPKRNSSFHLSYLACWQQCPGHCSIKKAMVDFPSLPPGPISW